jgi:hypothetical protein
MNDSSSLPQQQLKPIEHGVILNSTNERQFKKMSDEKLLMSRDHASGEMCVQEVRRKLLEPGYITS